MVQVAIEFAAASDASEASSRPATGSKIAAKKVETSSGISPARSGAGAVSSPQLSREVPLQESAWTSLQFKKIKANQVEFVDQELRVKVRSSASPLIHALPEPLQVAKVRVRGSWEEQQAAQRSSLEFDEDSLLRVGLVVPGQLTLSGPRRWLAADWVKKLFDLAPQGAGIDRIEFLMMASREDWVGRQRVHPHSELIRERAMSLRPPPGDFDVEWKLTRPIPAAALWLSVDGDDGGASFDLKLLRIELGLPEN